MANKKNDRYWENYVAAADIACQAADYLLACLKAYDADRINEMLTTMHEFEHRGDALRHEMTEALARSFVTPIDREDMVELSHRLDHVTDSIEEVLQAFYIHRIGQVAAESIRFAEMISSCTVKMKQILVELPGFKKSDSLRSLIIDVNTAEEACDALYLQANYNCLQGETKDPLFIMAWRDVYARLEECADACEHVADTVEAVVMKNT